MGLSDDSDRDRDRDRDRVRDCEFEGDGYREREPLSRESGGPLGGDWRYLCWLLEGRAFHALELGGSASINSCTGCWLAWVICGEYSRTGPVYSARRPADA